MSFWVFFYPFSPPDNQESQNFEKLKKPPADIIILHICTINNNHMMYGSWGIERDRQNFFILDHLLPFYPNRHYGPRKSKFWKNERNTWRYHHFIKVYTKWQSYDVSFLRYQTWWTEFFAILDHFLPFYSPNNPKNQNFKKMKKKPWRYYHFTHVYQKQQLYDVWFLRYGMWQTIVLSFWTIFYPFTLWKFQKIKILNKLKKRLEISSFYTNAPKIMIICHTVS